MLGWAAACGRGLVAKPWTGSLRELRRRDPEVMIERPVDEALAARSADQGALQAGGETGEKALGAQHPAEFPLVRIDELGVVAKGGLSVLPSLDHAPQLVAELDPEIEGGPDPLCRERNALAGGIADEEDAVLDPGPELVRDPVALVAHRRALEV